MAVVLQTTMIDLPETCNECRLAFYEDYSLCCPVFGYLDDIWDTEIARFPKCPLKKVNI
ncbi:MAG: hypothetical protein ILA11_11035 [Butyrivibrio sp.]|nr:hypothetical protein [Butyrivibrio sp.]